MSYGTRGGSSGIRQVEAPPQTLGYVDEREWHRAASSCGPSVSGAPRGHLPLRGPRSDKVMKDMCVAYFEFAASEKNAAALRARVRTRALKRLAVVIDAATLHLAGMGWSWRRQSACCPAINHA